MHIRQKGRELVQEHHQWIEKFARLGFVAQALNYATIGLLALQVAIGSGGRLTDSSGAIEVLSQQPLGPFLLGILGFGFAGYGLWFYIQAAFGQHASPRHDLYGRRISPDSAKQSSGKRAACKRIYAGVIGVIYTMLALSVFRILLNLGGNSGDMTRTWTGRLMSQPLGIWAVALTGLVIGGAGLYQFYKAFKEKFKDNIELGSLSVKARGAFMKLAKWGISARGVVFCIIGWFLVQAALNHNPNQARGLGGALHTIAAQPFGKILLGIVAVGLVLYAVYSAFKAKYYHVEVMA